jgi:hypothetical protein
MIIMSDNPDLRTARNRSLGFLKFEIDKAAPPDTILTIELYNGCYFPTGIGYYSMPAYFVPPTISGGQILIYPENSYKSYEDGKSAIFAYPNIFHSIITVVVDIPQISKAKIEICDSERNPIASLYDDTLVIGRHPFYWYAHDRMPGVYFCKLTTRDTTLFYKIYLK